jgi:hypothetical protein
VILDEPRLACECAWLKLHGHEHVVGYIVFAADSKARRGGEAKARVVLRMSEDDDRNKSFLPAVIESCPHQRRTDSLALMRGRHGHRGESREPEIGIPDERNRREQDVTDDRAFLLGDQRHERLRAHSKRVDEISLNGSFERRSIHAAHRRVVGLLLGSNYQRVHRLRCVVIAYTARYTRSERENRSRYSIGLRLSLRRK